MYVDISNWGYSVAAQKHYIFWRKEKLSTHHIWDNYRLATTLLFSEIFAAAQT